MRLRSLAHALSLAVALPATATALHAQQADSVPAPADSPGDGDTPPSLALPHGGLVLLGSAAEDRLRVLQLLGRAPTEGYLVRTPATLTAPGTPMGFRAVAPRVEVVHNSAIPSGANDGALWAGRGFNVLATAGVAYRSPRLTVVLAPQVAVSQNRGFDVIHHPGDDRSRFASPWHAGPESADLPLRFGSSGVRRLSPGQSRVEVHAGPLGVGASTENQWWGPGVQNGILMSSNAEGIPRLFVRTNGPLRTSVGTWEAEWMVGALSESAFFDTVPGNDTRSLSAVAVAYTPPGASGLTLGLARAVYAPADGWGGAAGNALDVFMDVGRPNARPEGDSSRVDGPDEILSVFGRWVFPADGLEVYGEWARHERPRSLRDLLVAPHHTQGYTVGLQWARPVGDAVLRLQAEATNLEQSATYRHRPMAPYYTSRPVPQGYTQRGQVVGAAIGPGASSQSLGADWIEPRWSVGVFGGRIRWENDTHYTLRPPRTFLDVGHDVSLLGGVRATLRLNRAVIRAEYASAMRYNYLFQYLTDTWGAYRGIDVPNRTLRLTVAPFGG